jgi:hypothetical protein
MILIFNLIGAALLGLFAAYIIKNKSHAKRINHYFCNAVRVYALTSEEDARIAILTAATVATKKQRDSMVEYLQSMASDMEKVSEENSEIKPQIDKFVKSSIELVEEISSREWTIADITSQKQVLGDINPKYLAALEKADPTIFAQEHPQLFK